MASDTEYKWVGCHWGEGEGMDTTAAITDYTNKLANDGWYVIDWKFAQDYWLLILMGRSKSEWAENMLNGENHD